MLLAVDVGNSQTVVGLFSGNTLVEQWRISTESGRTPDEFALIFKGLLAFADLSFTRNIHGVVIASVAPAELPPIARRVVPNRAGACCTSQRAAASQSSGAAGQGCSGASR